MQITEDETVYLIRISKGRVLDMAFGPAHVTIKYTCQWALEAIKERRLTMARKLHGQGP